MRALPAFLTPLACLAPLAAGEAREDLAAYAVRSSLLFTVPNSKQHLFLDEEAAGIRALRDGLSGALAVCTPTVAVLGGTVRPTPSEKTLQNRAFFNATDKPVELKLYFDVFIPDPNERMAAPKDETVPGPDSLVQAYLQERRQKIAAAAADATIEASASLVELMRTARSDRLTALEQLKLSRAAAPSSANPAKVKALCSPMLDAISELGEPARLQFLSTDVNDIFELRSEGASLGLDAAVLSSPIIVTQDALWSDFSVDEAEAEEPKPAKELTPEADFSHGLKALESSAEGEDDGVAGNEEAAEVKSAASEEKANKRISFVSQPAAFVEISAVGHVASGMDEATAFVEEGSVMSAEGRAAVSDELRETSAHRDAHRRTGKLSVEHGEPKDASHDPAKFRFPRQTYLACTEGEAILRTLQMHEVSRLLMFMLVCLILCATGGVFSAKGYPIGWRSAAHDDDVMFLDDMDDGDWD